MSSKITFDLNEPSTSSNVQHSSLPLNEPEVSKSHENSKNHLVDEDLKSSQIVPKSEGEVKNESKVSNRTIERYLKKIIINIVK